MGSSIRILLLGDLVGAAGLRALRAGLPFLVHSYGADLVIVNAENAFEGFGLTRDIAEQLFSIGVTVITTGNHIWQRREICGYMQSGARILRPANYPGSPPGVGHCVIQCRDIPVGVISLQGRVRLSYVDCPFYTADAIIQEIKRSAEIVIIDFHAEDAEEKESLGWYLDGSVSLVAGTHTHVQTADERISEKGTAYITDIGMTGSVDSVIGFDSAIAVERMEHQMPLKMQVADNTAAIRGIALEVDTKTARSLSIHRVDYLPEP